MTLPSPVEAKRKYFSIDEANRMLPLVRVIVSDIVDQWRIVTELESRLNTVRRREGKRLQGDLYSEEFAQTEAEFDVEQSKLKAYLDELEKLGVELKGPDGLCDFYSLRDGREVYLCWRLGEPEVAHWHELEAGFGGRQPLNGAKAGSRMK
jgi:hypothetical protein